MRKIRVRKMNGFADSRVQAYETSHRAIARRAAAAGMVLLKNDGILPLQKGTAVALYGAGASRTVKGGTGSGDVNERDSVSIWQGMKNAGFRITDEDWLRDYDAAFDAARKAWRDDILSRIDFKDAFGFFDVYASTPFIYPVGGPVTATDADTAVYVISRNAGEGADRHNVPGDYQLTEAEKNMLHAICGCYRHVIVAVNAGGLIDLSFLDENEGIDALLYIVQPGMEGGNAFADILSGAVTPSGKLTDSWAYRYEDYPSAGTFSYESGDLFQETYGEGIYTGYRYFDTFGIPVRFGFGYGLSYTSFRLADGGVQVQYPQGPAAEEPAYGCFDEAAEPFVSVRTTVTNTGAAAGRETVQVYVSCPEGRLEKEFRRLAGFGKTSVLQPGESGEVTVKFPLYLLASYDEPLPGWVLEKGQYGIWCGNSLENAVPVAELSLEKECVLVRTKNICARRKPLQELSGAEAGRRRRAEAVLPQTVPCILLDAAQLRETQIDYRDPDAVKASAEAEEIAGTLSREQMIRLVVGDPGRGQGAALGSAGVTVPGAAGETSPEAKDRGVANIVLADGPAGLRLENVFAVGADGNIIKQPFFCSLEKGIFAPEKDTAAGEEPVRRYQYCTAFPVGTLLAQSFDPALLEEVGKAVGEEMRIFHVTLWLAPGMNIHRNPLCGRNFEYYSEDPLVAGLMAAAITKGVQSVDGCGTTIKHFAGNNQEDNRMGSEDIISERALREIYLRGFEIAVKSARPMAMMTSYNLINGVHSANNADLCTAAARNEWGLRGLIMTDWTTTTNSTDPVPCTAAGCIRAGNDLVMPGADPDFEDLRKELQEGTLTEEQLRGCAARIIDVVLRSAEYEKEE